MVAAAGAGVGAVEVEGLGAEAGGAGVGVDAGGDVDQLRPRRRRVDVDLEHPGVGGHDEPHQPGVVRRQVALDHDRLPERGCRVLDHVQQVDGMLEVRDRRQEYEELALAGLDAQRAARHLFGLDHFCFGTRPRRL